MVTLKTITREMFLTKYEKMAKVRIVFALWQLYKAFAKLTFNYIINM